MKKDLLKTIIESVVEEVINKVDEKKIVRHSCEDGKTWDSEKRKCRPLTSQEKRDRKKKAICKDKGMGYSTKTGKCTVIDKAASRKRSLAMKKALKNATVITK